jgi:phosphatidylinositol phospholipase C, beta
MRLCFSVDAKGQVPVKVIAKTFASGKTEKLVYSSLQELELPNGKVMRKIKANQCHSNK